MDARIALPSVLRGALTRRRSADRTVDHDFNRGLGRVLSSYHPARWEVVFAVGVLFLLSRGPVLFVRSRLVGWLGSMPYGLWQDDAAIQVFLGGACLAGAVIAFWRTGAGPLLRQPVLNAYLLVALLSATWSIQPATSMRRALLLVGTVVVAVWIGERFGTRGVARLAVLTGVAATISSGIGLLFFTDLATATGVNKGWWSGVFVNRNWLALALSIGLLALLYEASSGIRAWHVCAGVPMIALLTATGSKTSVLALAATIVSVGWIWILRRLGSTKHPPGVGALVVVCTLGSIGMLVHTYWTSILSALQRDPTLTGRTAIWEVARWYSRQHPWFGWGYDALWSDRGAIRLSTRAVGRRVWDAHSGYYDIALGVGRVGLALFIAFLALATWRTFRYAWRRSDFMSMWPLSIILFGAIVNFSESIFIANEALTVFVVAVTVAVTERPKRDSPGLHSEQRSSAGQRR